MKLETETVDFPLRGEWKAIRSPGHHQFAYDFAAVGEDHEQIFAKSMAALLLGTATVTDSYSWSEPIYAPISGRIIQAKDELPDRQDLNLLKDMARLFVTSIVPPDDTDERLRAFAGNYVIIGSGNVYTFMAHLQQDSIEVNAGEEVRRGEPIGLVGNSGSTLGPHLHFQMMDGADPFNTQIMAFTIRNYERWTGIEWERMKFCTPEKGECIRYAK